MGRVFELEIPAREKLLLLAMADRGSEVDGRGAYESVRTLGRKSSTAPRHVHRLLRRLENAGFVRPVGTSKYGTIEYQITLANSDAAKLERKRKHRRQVGKTPDTESHHRLTMRASTSDFGGPQPPDINSAASCSAVTRSVSVSQSSSKNRSARSGLTPSQFREKVPVETPNGARTSVVSFPSDPLRAELNDAIRWKELQDAFFDCNHHRLSLEETFRELARIAELHLRADRVRKTMRIRRGEIATAVFQRCEPHFVTFEAIRDSVKRRDKVIEAVVRRTLDVTTELLRPQRGLFDAGVGG